MGKYDYGTVLPENGPIAWAFRNVPAGATVLELGAANGLLTRHLKEDKGCTVDIVEIDAESGAEAAAFAGTALLGAEGDLDGSAWYDRLKNKTYDYILSIDVLEHLRDPRRVLKLCRTLLAEDGTILMSIPNVGHNAVLTRLYNDEFRYQERGIMDDTHLRFFTRSSIDALVRESGMVVTKREVNEESMEDCLVRGSYAQVPVSVARALQTRPGGLVAQYLITARKTGAFAPGDNTPGIEDKCIVYNSDRRERYLREFDVAPIRLYQANRVRLKLSGDWRQITLQLCNAPACVYGLAVFGVGEQGQLVRLNAEDSNGFWVNGNGVFTHVPTLWFTLPKDEKYTALDIRMDGLEPLEQEELACMRHMEAENRVREDRARELQTRLEEQTNDNERRITGLAEEKERLTAQIRDLSGENDRLQGEKEKLSSENGRLQGEKEKLSAENDRLRDENDGLSAENDRLLAERRRLREKTAVLDEQTRQLEALRQSAASLETRNQELAVELNNKKGHIELLLESDRELERIHNSRSWKFMGIFWKIRAFLLPVNSRRCAFVKLVLKFLRHPIKCLRKLNKKRIKRLVDGIETGQIQETMQRVDNCLAAEEVHTEPVKLIGVSEEKRETAGDYERFSVPTSTHPLVSIVIPVYNQFHYTYACLKSIAEHSGDMAYEVLIANDCSTDLTTQLEEIVGGVKVITNEKNLRFLRNCNHAAREAKGQYILFLNNDTQVQEDWLRPLVELIESDPAVGMVGSKLIYPDGRLQEAGGILWKDGSAWNYGHLQDPSMPEFNYVKEADYISGASIMIRTRLWKQLGGFDETFAPAYCEDSDLAFQVRAAGYKVLYQPRSVVVHFEGVSNGTDTSSGQKAYQVINSQKFYEKWKDVLEREHNPNAVNPFLARDRSLHKKTLLMVDHYVPQYDRDAGSRTVFQYLKLFVSQGYNVKFIGDNFYQHEPYTTVLQQMGVEVLYGPWYAQHWKEWIQQNGDNIGYVFLNRPHIAVKYIDWIREKTHARIIYYGHDLHFLRTAREAELTGKSALLKDAEDWKEKEFSLMRKADMAYYPSEVEVKEIHRIEPTIAVKAIPAYLFDAGQREEFQPQRRRDLMFVGGYNHGPNVDAVLWMVEKIMPELRKLLPDVKFHMIGSNAPKEVIRLADDHVIYDGMVSDQELDGFYRSCRVSVVPLRYGAGIKGKVVEAMQKGMPVMTTSVGAEGIEDAENILCVEDDPVKFAEKLAALYRSDEELERRSAASQDYIARHFSPANAVKVIGGDFDM